MRPEQIVAKALKSVDDDRYLLTLMVAKRAQSLAEGSPILLDIDTKNMKFADIALLEIAQGKVKLDAITQEC